MNVMQIAYTKALIRKIGKTTSKNGKQIGKALKEIYQRVN